jgi:hypothetical protein
MKAFHSLPVHISGICPKVLALLFITLHETFIWVDKVDLLLGGSEEV